MLGTRQGAIAVVRRRSLRGRRATVAVAALVGVWADSGLVFADQPADALRRAAAYLAQEVARWPEENGCYSCHHSGDGVRALQALDNAPALKNLPAQTEPIDLTPAATHDFLLHPKRWADNGVDGEFNDQTLATVQFAWALTDIATDGQGHPADAVIQPDDLSKAALQSAAELLIPLQSPDGDWRLTTGEQLGSPVTYGRVLVTGAAVQVLRAAQLPAGAQALRAGEAWLLQHTPTTAYDWSALLVALRGLDSAAAAERRNVAAAEVLRGQQADGGWGPYRISESEPYDTALAMIALSGVPRSPEIRQALTRGADWLCAAQAPEGHWPETTRPSGGVSRAHRVSTTSWCAMALAEVQKSADLQ